MLCLLCDVRDISILLSISLFADDVCHSIIKSIIDRGYNRYLFFTLLFPLPLPLSLRLTSFPLYLSLLSLSLSLFFFLSSSSPTHSYSHSLFFLLSVIFHFPLLHSFKFHSHQLSTQLLLTSRFME